METLRTTLRWRASLLTSSFPPSDARKSVSARRVSLRLDCAASSPRFVLPCPTFYALPIRLQGIAVKSLQLFLSQIQNAPEQLKLNLLKIVFDLMTMYDQQLWARAEDVRGLFFETVQRC